MSGESDFDEALSPLRWRAGALELLDQRALPAEERWLAYSDYRGVATAIKDMVVRGAPAIGCAAAYGVALGALARAPLKEVIAELRATRPTAVNLFWALDRMAAVAAAGGGAEPLVAEARAIHAEDLAACRAIGDHGAPLIPDGVVLTHCNAGALATGGYGTALGVVRSAHRQGRRLRVFADETRPFLQGARLTAWELMKSGIDVTLVTDGMAAHLMQRGEIQSVIVGADRIARNGDAANKIGTYAVALAAREHGLPFFVAAPRSTIDRAIPDGAAIPIEERDPGEVTHLGGRAIAPAGARVRNPAFDVTPSRLITAIITEVGVARAPYQDSLAALCG
jgi:methylthioribose-1-phosphate isomerase